MKNEAQFKKLINEIITKNHQKVPRLIHYECCGWKILEDRTWGYVHSNGIIGRDGTGISGGKNRRFDIKESLVGTFDNFQRFMNMENIYKNKNISRTFMVFTTMSVLTTLFETAGFPIKFLLGVLGTTNTMKTSTAMVYTKIFNATETQTPENSFVATVGGIETMIAEYVDSVLLVDDFKPADTRGKQSDMNDKMELLVRTYGDRTVKKRMLDFCDKNVEYQPQGCCAFTGEHLTGVESSRTRILVLKIAKGEVNKDILTDYQNDPWVLPTYLYGFIDFISRDVQGVMNYISQKVAEYRRNANYNIERYNETQAVLFTTIDLMENYWVSRGFVKYEDGIGNVWKQSIAEIVWENDKKSNEFSVPKVIFTALCEKVSKFPGILKRKSEMTKEDGTCVYEDEDFVYVQSTDLFLWVKDYCRKFELDFYLTEHMMKERLKEVNALKIHIENIKGKPRERSTSKLDQSCNAKRYLFIKKTQMNEILDGDISM